MNKLIERKANRKEEEEEEEEEEKKKNQKYKIKDKNMLESRILPTP